MGSEAISHLERHVTQHRAHPLDQWRLGQESRRSRRRRRNRPVIGGHAGITIIPALSQLQPKGIIDHLSEDEISTLTERIQNAGTEVVQAKAGGGSATLSMAYAAARFADSVIRAMNGEDVVEFAYIPVDEVHGVNVEYFSCPVMFAQDGSVKENLGLGVLNEREDALVADAEKQLAGEIAKGVEFATKF